jgi:hypothetical protein
MPTRWRAENRLDTTPILLVGTNAGDIRTDDDKAFRQTHLLEHDVSAA